MRPPIGFTDEWGNFYPSHDEWQNVEYPAPPPDPTHTPEGFILPAQALAPTDDAQGYYGVLPAIHRPPIHPVLPGLDFETYSEAGYENVTEPKMVKGPNATKEHSFSKLKKLGWNDEQLVRQGYGAYGAYQKWRGTSKTATGYKAGIGVVGTYAYAEHPSTELLSLAYTLKPGTTPKLWVPGMPPPQDLFDYIAAGGLLAGWHTLFEFLIWHFVCVHKYGWPPLPLDQLRDTMARANAHGLPGALGAAGPVIGAKVGKDKEGTAVMKRVSVPRTPTKSKNFDRHTPENSPGDFAHLYSYNIDDVRAEEAVGALVPDLSPTELDLWLTDQRINTRGVQCDRPLIEASIKIVNEALRRGNEELADITGGLVPEASKGARLVQWLGTRGLQLPNYQAETIENAAGRTDLPADVRRALEIRVALGGAAVKKLFAMQRQLGNDSRLHCLFKYWGARMTGRWAGADVQPHNLPNSGPDTFKCPQCGAIYGVGGWCPHCQASGKPQDWGIEAMEAVIPSIMTGSVDVLAANWGDPLTAVSGCLRGIFCAAPGHELIGSDYSAIEAVGAAALAGEQWRLDVFNTHGKIYEMSASSITGVPFEEMMAHAGYTDLSIDRWWEAPQTGKDHPDRKTIGKVAELASGFQGWVGAWIAFGADQFMTEDQMKEAILAWRAKSPEIVNMWAGLQDAAHMAVANPGQCFQYKGIVYGVKEEILYCQLHSGRMLKYHRPRLELEETPWGKKRVTLSFEGWNNDPKRGPTNRWIRMYTHGGRLFENVDQAESRDVLGEALVRLDKKYPIVLHVHDEAVGEVPQGYGSVEEFEQIMAIRPEWAQHWPIKASGGWRGLRYRKG